MIKDDIDTRIYVDCEENVSTQTVIKIKYKKPSSDTGDWTAILGTDTVTVNGVTLEANTYIYYDTIDGDIDEAGDWNIQAYVELSGGWKGHGTDNDFEPWSIMHVGDHI